MTVLQLSGRLVAKCDLWNGWATQILPNTGPTGNPRISFAEVHVRSSHMQPCWTCGYQYNNEYIMYMHIFFSIVLCRTTQNLCGQSLRTYWVVLWATQDFSLAQSCSTDIRYDMRKSDASIINRFLMGDTHSRCYNHDNVFLLLFLCFPVVLLSCHLKILQVMTWYP